MNHNHLHIRNSHRRAGFTLVEMLVATALVVLMMLLFANIFTSAVGTMTEQRGLANNDSKARILDSTIRGDLEKMTYRQPQPPYADVRGIVPLAPGDIVDTARQKGYWYYSENDPLDPTDDVLQFTIDVRMVQRSDSNTPLFGRATILGIPNGDGQYPLSQRSPSWNQPVWDDGNPSDSTTISRAAEIQYFVRNGNLYRRAYLLRDPLEAPASEDLNGNQTLDQGEETSVHSFGGGNGLLDTGVGFFTQPTHFSGIAVRYFARTPSTSQNYSLDYDPTPIDLNGDGTPDAGDFYNDFDMSVTRFASTLHFNGINSLENGAQQSELPIALPYMRSGFAPYGVGGAVPTSGRPREFSNPNAAASGTVFLGRFTQEETSHPLFLFPGYSVNPTNANQSVVWTNSAFTLPDSDGDKVIDGFANGPRRGEDLLMVGVESFDVKVWDGTYAEPDVNANGGFEPIEDLNQDGVRQTSGMFVDIGHSHARRVSPSSVVPGGVYSLWQNQNPNYGPFVVPPGPGPVGNVTANITAINSGVPQTSAFRTTAEAPPAAAFNVNRVYDTWSPDYWHWALDSDGNNTQTQTPTDLNGDGVISPSELDLNNDMVSDQDLANSRPPYRPLQVPLGDARILAAWPNMPPAQPNGPPPPSGGWAAGQRAPGQVFFPPNSNGSIGYRVLRSGEAVLNSNGSFTAVSARYADYNGNGQTDFAISNATQPEWPLEVGVLVTENGNTATPADDVVWQAFDNRIGLQMIQITIRYLDPGSGLSRQVTIQHSFVE